MSDEVGSEQEKNAEAPRELTTYEKMSHEMQLKWEERVFNTLKLRNLLLDADSIITYAYLLWTRFALIVAILLAINPERFPWRLDFCYAFAAFLVYYALIGFMRRQTEKNFKSLCAQHPDPEHCQSGAIFKDKRPYQEEDDPPLARRFFRLRGKLGIPRRGAAQKEVIVWQFVVAVCYIVNYAWYVLWCNTPADESQLSLLWMLYVTMTAGGVLILVKNVGLLADTNRLIKNIEGLAGSFLGHSGTSVTIEGGSGKPCKPCEEKK